MGPLPYGPSTTHVNASNGADVKINQFYITEYSNKYGKDGFMPRAGGHKGTGYQSNFRPGVYYSRKIDELDNPKLGKLLADNYNSVTKIHFKDFKGSNGKDPLPKQIYMVKSGFVRDTQPTIPATKQVRSVCVDTKYEGTVYPTLKPHLHKIRSKDPIAQENAGHGPSFMSTESHSNYKGFQSKTVDPLRALGSKEETGFTHAFNDEPITFKPNDAHDGKYPGWYTWRPTGTSMMKADFRPSRYLTGNEAFTTVATRSDRDTGYTREIKPNGEFTGRPEHVFTKLNQVQPLVQQRIKKQDPAEYANMVHAREYPSMSATTFRGLQREKETLPERLGNLSFGNKEDTGYTENNCKYVQSAESPQSLQRYNTEYYTRFFDKTPMGEARMGNTKGNVMEQPHNGFTKSTAVHDFGNEINTTEHIRNLHPYVQRSIKARDPYYVSQIHEHKKKPITA